MSAFARSVIDQAASDLISRKYFDGECIMLKDSIEDLQKQTKLALQMMYAYDGVAIKAGRSERATDSSKINKAVEEQASKKAAYIVALAKSKMLDDFGEPEAADAIIKPYFLEGLTDSNVSEGTT